MLNFQALVAAAIYRRRRRKAVGQIAPDTGDAKDAKSLAEPQRPRARKVVPALDVSAKYAANKVDIEQPVEEAWRSPRNAWSTPRAQPSPRPAWSTPRGQNTLRDQA